MDQTSKQMLYGKIIEGFPQNDKEITSHDRDGAGHFFFVYKVQCPFPCVWVAGPDVKQQRHVVQVVSGREKRYASTDSDYVFSRYMLSYIDFMSV